MAYLSLIQFENWNEHDVANWLKGLDDAIHPYIPDFIEEGIDGKKLMMITHSDLDKLGVSKLGHQELILEGVDLLMSLRYMFETENLQHLALQLGCKARSLHNEIIARNGENDQNRANIQMNKNYRQISISVLSSICDIMNTLKILTSWLDRSPFESIYDISLLRNSIVKLGLELVTDAQKEYSVTEVENAIVKSCQDMTEYCDKLVLNMKESLVVQPAFLETAVIRKKQDDELGMHIQSLYCGIHVIGCIKERSPADLCSKVEKGDEVLQVNNQTVLGWQLVKLVAALKEKPKEVTMLLKKRPRHANPFGIIQNRRQLGNRHHVPSVATLPKTLKKRRSREGEKPARPTLQEYVTSSIPSGDIYITKESPEDTNDGNDTDNDVFRSGSESPQFTLPVMVDAKQRRATVSGGSPTFERPLLVVEDLGSGPVRPKSQAINQAERDAAIASLLASDNMLQRRPSKKSSSNNIVDDNKELTPDSALKADEDNNNVVRSSNLNETTTTNNKQEEEEDKGDKPADSCPDTKDEEKTPAVSDSSSGTDSKPADTIKNEKEEEETVSKEEEITTEEDDNINQGFMVRKPTPLVKESPPTALKSWNKRQKDKVDDDDVFVKPQKRVGFTDDVTDCDKEESFTHIVVGNVVQKIPTEKAGTFSKLIEQEDPVPQGVQMRKKTANSRKRLDRRVSCKDLGKGDCEGWLYKRKHSTLSKHWAKRWCVLKAWNFFYYKAKEDCKAEGVIHLPAFQVSPASNFKTKKFEHGAFKIHNPGTCFYFASERQDDMGKWMNKMGLAAISYMEDRNHGNHHHPSSSADPANSHDKANTTTMAGSRDEDFSESEDEGEDEKRLLQGSLQSLTSVSSLGSTNSPQGSPLIRRHLAAGGGPTKGPSSVGASTEALNSMLQAIQTNDLTIDGKDRIAHRKSQCTAVADLPCPLEDQEEIDKLRKLNSLQRTLKAKEQELEDLDRLMTSSLTSSDSIHFSSEDPNNSLLVTDSHL